MVFSWFWNIPKGYLNTIISSDKLYMETCFHFLLFLFFSSIIFLVIPCSNQKKYINTFHDFKESFVMEKNQCTWFNVIKLKQTYQTTELACSQERWDLDHTFGKVIMYSIQWDSTIKCLPASSTNVNCHDTMTLIHILFSKQKWEITTCS